MGKTTHSPSNLPQNQSMTLFPGLLSFSPREGLTKRPPASARREEPSRLSGCERQALASTHTTLAGRVLISSLFSRLIWDIIGRLIKMIDYFPGSDYERKLKKQRGRIYHRLLSGFYFNRYERLRFMTVTSTPNSPSLADSWKELVKRIRRVYKQFEYFAIFTNEGCGVIHVVFVGTYIPFEWLQEQWKAIHEAFHVNIKEVKKVWNAQGLAGYFLRQYLSNQNAVRTINQSRGWVFQGYMNDWNYIKRRSKTEKATKYQMLAAWHYHLDSHIRTEETQTVRCIT